MATSLCKSARSLTVLAAMLALLQGAPARAQALNAKSWVSNVGSDANLCTLAQPCATFQRAHDQTNAGGEVGVLTPGDYGGVGLPRLTITKSINITNDGTGEASILAPFDIDAIRIIAGTGDVASLRGLVIDGQFSGEAGILIFSTSAVHIQNCVIRNMERGTASGIVLPSAGHTQLFVSDTIIFNNGNDANSGGILIFLDSFSNVNVVLDRVHLENNVIGLLVDGHAGTGTGAHVVVRDSVISGNAANGIHALTVPGASPAFLVVERTTVVNNAGTGILANGPHATMLLDGNVVSRNGVGINAINSGQLISYGNNKVNNNLGADGVPTGSYSPI